MRSLLSLVLLLGLAACSKESGTVQPIVVYCAAGLKGPVEAAAKAYEAGYQVPVSLHFGGSQTLLANVEVS